MSQLDYECSSLAGEYDDLTDPCAEKADAFLPLLEANQSKIRAYILSLVPNSDDADEILQETIYIMWKKFDRFESGSSFDSWGVKIAYYNILSHYRRNRKEVRLDESLFGQVFSIEEKESAADERIEILKYCVNRLSEDDLKLLNNRYVMNYSVKNISDQMNRSSKFVYKRLSQILDVLYGKMKIMQQNIA